MSFDIQVVALINLVLQTLLMSTAFVAVYLVKTRRLLVSHCRIMTVALIAQIVAVAFVMLPSLLGYVQNEVLGLPLSLEMPVHHVLGVVVSLWIYVSLALKGIIKTRIRLVIPMRLAFGSWLVAFVLGLHIYFSIYL